MKTLNLIAWLSAGAGTLIIIFAVISLLIGRNLFGYKHVVSYFHAANSFFLVTIALFIYTHKCNCKSEE